MSIATAEQAVVDAAPKQLLIGGEWRDGTGGATLAVEDPATGEAVLRGRRRHPGRREGRARRRLRGPGRRGPRPRRTSAPRSSTARSSS